MAKYQKRVNIHLLTDSERGALQPGQHISAGGAPGRWIGQTPRSDVAAWRGNAARQPNGAIAYMRMLRTYVRRVG